MIPVLLLDIDGVVNAMSKQAPLHVWKGEHWQRGSCLDLETAVNYPLLWSTPVVDWLTVLHEQGLAEVRWHTTWQHQALEFAKIVGLPEFKVQDCPEWYEYCTNGSALSAKLINQGHPQWWKYPAASSVMFDEQRDLIWIDDDIDYQLSARARMAVNAMARVRLISPAQSTGIIPKHMKIAGDAIEYWKENPRV